MSTETELTDEQIQAVLALEMEPNDSGARTVRGYLAALLTELWDAGENFSGKRPFGNSSWEYDLYQELGKAGLITASFDSYGYIGAFDEEAGRRLIAAAIAALGKPAPAAPDALTAALLELHAKTHDSDNDAAHGWNPKCAACGTWFPCATVELIEQGRGDRG